MRKRREAEIVDKEKVAKDFQRSEIWPGWRAFKKSTSID
jgi:outer membrane protein